MAVDYKSIVAEPKNVGGPASYVLYLSGLADEFGPWGSNTRLRDKKLREFWPTEPMLASAMFSTVSKYTAFGWMLEGPGRQARIVRERLHNSEHGKGWEVLNSKTLIDLFTQDNGAFQEIVRASDDPMAPALAVNHLDSARCYRTGIADYPVIYTDINGRQHKMPWYSVITLEEFPSPEETRRGMQYCTVTRMLKAAQFLRGIATYKEEKISGKYAKAVHLVSGVGTQQIEDALGLSVADDAQRGNQFFHRAAILGSIDPTANVHAATLDLAGLPDGFDEEVAMRWYINQLALAFGADYQDFAPLPGGNLGSAHQSQVLHLKSRGKGPALYMSMVEHKYNFHGVMPRTVTFRFGKQDTAQDIEQAELKKLRGEDRANRIASGEIDARVARLEAVDAGDLDPRYLALFGEEDPTHEIKISSSD